MTDIEDRFDRYFDTLEATDPLKSAHILDLESAETAEVRELAKAFADIKAEINARFATNAADIVAPEGSVQIHMDYIGSSTVNAYAFYFDGWYFIGITEGMLDLFAKSCVAFWRLNLLSDILGVELSSEHRDLIFQFALLLELQYISNHELGHMFHGHCAGLRAGRYREEFSVAALVAESHGMEGQARELEADGYAINLLLKNLLLTESGTHMHTRVASTKSLREFVLRLFILSLAAVLYHLDIPPFDASKVRSRTHSEGLVRMNILIGEILGWCADNVDWPNSISLEEFQDIMDLVATAASNTSQDQIWRDQGAYLLTEEGKNYLNDIYKRRANLRAKMNPHRWRLSSEEPPTGAGGEQY
jgi:hypothetical protein